jgi:pimeloyl-ACP methyl ester carboxylesterase
MALGAAETLRDRIVMQIIEPIVSLQCGELNLDVATRFREQGDDLLILLHGLGCSKESFEGAFDAPELRGYAICALDFPGHGGSSRNLPSGCYSLEACADITGQLIRRVMAKRGYNRVYVAGHSMGGAVAVLLPDGEYGITSLVSIDGNLIGEDCGLVSRSIAEQSVEQFVSKGYYDFNSALHGSAQPDAQAWARWSSNAAPEAMHAAAKSLVEWSDSGKLLEQFNSIRTRAFLYGERDDKAYLLSRIEDATIAVVPAAAHFMMVDNPAAFYRILATALERSSAGSVVGLRRQDSLQPVL